MDNGQFVALMQPHIPTAVRIATALVGMADSEDAVQEAFVRAWKAWPDLREPELARSWLLRIVVNVCQDWRRSSFGTHRHRVIPITDELPLLSTALGDNAHVDALDLAQAIATLEEGLRQIVQLRYFAGLDATEIGAVLHLPPATIRTRLRRALTLLRHNLLPKTVAPIRSPLEAEL
ncbi:MAG: RNA polymerase sigma factor [Ktedonobacteraceae bacterium]|nr:RNA polymerase sigma factor [Ktedonobacteraceae bacterium]MBA3824670.1 RNA polymerase sigma factor [Ktedonobacterales bacterium]